MNSTTLSVLAAVIVGGLAGLFVITSSRRDRALLEDYATVSDNLPATTSGREVEEAAKQGTSETAAVATWVPPTPEAIGVSRRQFLNRSILAMFGLGLAGFGVASIAFLWPNKVVGFGGKVNVGKLSDLLSKIESSKEPVYIAEARAYIQKFPTADLAKAKGVGSYAPVIAGMEQGVVALYQKCVHLGCKVPWCKSSQWFECPCHGSRYNAVGEKKGGPAPRGLDRFGVSVSGGSVIVDTGMRVLGPPVGTNTTGQEAEGPHC